MSWKPFSRRNPAQDWTKYQGIQNTWIAAPLVAAREDEINDLQIGLVSVADGA